MTAPVPERLDEPRAQPCEEGMDDMGAYAETQGREFLEGMLVVDCPEASHG